MFPSCIPAWSFGDTRIHVAVMSTKRVGWESDRGIVLLAHHGIAWHGGRVALYCMHRCLLKGQVLSSYTSYVDDDDDSHDRLFTSESPRPRFSS